MPDTKDLRSKGWHHRCALIWGVFLVWAVTSALQTPVAAQEAGNSTLRVRAGDHPDYSRLVFDWAEPPEYSMVRDGSQLIIEFDSVVDVDLSNVERRRPRNIRDIAMVVGGGRLRFLVRVPETASLKSFRLGPKVVVDVGNEERGRETAVSGVSRSTGSAEAGEGGNTASDVVPTVRVRSGIHPDKNRIVFDYREPVSVDNDRDGSTVTLRFSRPAQFDLGRVVPRQLRNLEAIEQIAQKPEARVSVRVRNGSTVRTFLVGTKVVLDIGDPSPEAVRQAKDSEVTEAERDNVRPMTAGAEKSGDVEESVESGNRNSQNREPSPRATEETAKTGVSETEPVPGLQPQDRKSTEQNPGLEKSAPAESESDRQDLGQPNEKASEPKPKEEEGRTFRFREAGVDRGERPGVVTLRDVRLTSDGTEWAPVEPKRGLIFPESVRGRIRFAVEDTVGAVAYVRGGTAVVVFDSEVNEADVVIEAAARTTVPTIESHRIAGGSAFSIPLSGLLEARFAKTDGGWQLNLQEQAEPPAMGVGIRAEPDFALGGRIVVESGPDSKILEMKDPVVGEPVMLVPLRIAKGVRIGRDLNLLAIIPTLQGVAVRLRSDQVIARAVSDGVELTTPTGLALSPSNDRERATPMADASDGLNKAIGAVVASIGDQGRTVSQKSSLLQLAVWKRGTIEDFNEQRQSLQMAVVDAPPERKIAAQLSLAQFYAGHGLFQEALGVLAVVEEKEPDFRNWPVYQALKGTASIGAGRYREGVPLLSNPSLDEHPESRLWRARAEAEQRHWEAAAPALAENLDRIGTYPEPHFSQFSKLAIETFLETGEPEAAQKVFERWVARGGETVTEGPAAQYFGGRLALMGEEPDVAAAREQLQSAAESWDRLYRAEARLALINQDLADNEINPTQAVDRLSDLRFAWRGDLLELDILERKGEVEWLAGNYADSLLTMREAAGLFPESDRATQITANMAQNFTQLFADGAKVLPPLEALGLYNQFRELTPVGHQGDQVIRQLAERLVEVDLLDRASELLAYQVDYRLAGEERARVGARLATINLLDGKPDGALQALDRSRMADPPSALGAERRRLRARALAKLERPYEALEQIAEDRSREADLLRVDIAWANRDWNLAASVLGRLMPAETVQGDLSADQTKLIINRAIALGLAGDDAALAALKDEFGNAMSQTDQNGLFQVLTRPDPVERRLSRELIEARVSEVDAFSTVLEGYQTQSAGGGPGTG